MTALWFVAGPPLGEGIFRGTCKRMGGGELRSLLSSDHPADGWKERGAQLAKDLEKAGDVMLVAHGLAVPAAIQAALLTPPRVLVLSNGPIRRLDPVATAIGRIATLPGSQALFRPGLWLRYLSSSAGLRRTVVNPYVMDRDTIATLASGAIQDRGGRKALASYLSSLCRGLPDPAGLRGSTWLIWADQDPLYPAYEADSLDLQLGGNRHLAVPGGQHFHPEERPWELAERLQEILRREGIQGVP